MTTLDTHSTVAQWVSEQPRSARVFENLKIDYCCGGNTALATACERQQLDVAAVVAQLDDVVATEPSEPTEHWLQKELVDLCDHIEQTHHAYLRQELPRLSCVD